METISYHTLLLSRQPGKFTEPEAMAVLQQVLPQLEQIHRQNLSHNNIRLDTIVTNQQQIFLLPSDYKQSANPSKDMYDFGMAMIELLTGKYSSLMKASDGSFNWDNYCTVSDQLIAIINRLITPNYYSHFRSATEALSEQPVLSYQPPTVVPPNLSQPPTVVPTRPSSFISSSQKKWKMPIWGWAIAGSVFVFAVGVAIALPNLLGQVGKARESQGMNGVGAIVHGQMKKYLETGKFYNSIEELGPVDMYSGKFYVVNMNVIDNNRAIITATPKEDNIRSYLGVIYLNGNELISGVCRSLSPSITSLSVPDLSGNNVLCPTDATLVSNQSGPVPQQFAQNSIYLTELNVSNGISIIENLYSFLSNKQFDSAYELYASNLQRQFNTDFFNRFNRVTI